MDYAPLSRIILRYIVGAAAMGSQEVGERLAADPDLVLALSVAVGIAVEGFYAASKKWGWST